MPDDFLGRVIGHLKDLDAARLSRNSRGIASALKAVGVEVEKNIGGLNEVTDLAKLRADNSRLRDTNQVLFGERADALRREDRQRVRAETAEDRIREIEGLSAHVAMERAHYADRIPELGGFDEQTR